MGIFTELSAKLNKSRHLSIPSLSPFLVPDPRKIAGALNVEARARADGAQGLPSAESEAPSLVEDEITAAFIELRGLSQKTLQDNLDAYSAILTDSSVEDADVSRAIVEGERAIESMQNETRAANLGLLQLRNDMKGLEKEFNLFRKRNHLDDRLPHYPGSKAVNVLGLILLLALETVLNGNFFARGSDQGLIGGIFAAVVLSAANLSFGFFSGLFAWRGVNLIQGFKYFAWVGVALWIAGTFMLNLFIAQYRDLFAENAGKVSSESVFARMGEGVSSLQETESFVLLMLGCLFNLAAAADGYKFDDRYPRYGGIDRRRRKAAQRYQEAFTYELDQLAHHRDSAINEISDALAAISEKAKMRTRAEAGRAALVQSYEDHTAELNRVHAAVLRRYWDGNARARSVPAPKRFNTSPPILPAAQVIRLMPVPAGGGPSISQLQAALKGFLDRCRQVSGGLESDEGADGALLGEAGVVSEK